MNQYKLQEIRNVGLIGHGSSGKTSIAEAILYTSGVADRLGKAGDTSSMMDYDADEIKRGHTISASLAYCEWDKHKINILDTPGDNNFIADTPACIRVIEDAVVVIGADDGIQFYTEKVWQWADDQELSRIVFLNKLDHERANIPPILENLKKKFKKTPVFLQMPVGQGDSFTGVVDLVENKYYSYEKEGKGKGKVIEIPADLADSVENARAELTEAVAEVDDELIEVYLEKGELTDEEFHKGLKSGIENGQLIPVLCGSGVQNMGIDLLLKAVIDYLPSPDKRNPVTGKSPKDGSETERKADPAEPFSSLVFKTVADPYSGKLTLFRVYSGSIKADSSVFNASKENNERIGQIYLLQGKKQIPVSEISAGDIGAVAKLKVTTTGDSLADPAKAIVFDAIQFPVPVFSQAILPKTRADEEKISAALHRVTEEDPTLKVERNAQTHELLVSGMGQLHLDVIIERLKQRFGVEVDTKPPKVPYLETIRGSTKIQGKYKKQTGGRGQFGDTWLEISPLEKGGGFVFEDKIVGGAIPKTYIPAVEKGIQEAMTQGVIAHYPMVDVRVKLYDGSYHNVDSSEMAFKIAGSLGFKKGVVDCRPILLEPIMNMQVVIPSDYVGDIMGDLNSKRGKIQGIDADDDMQTIRVHVPMAEILNYAADLRSLTSGRGMFVMEFDHYDDVPEHLSKKIIEQANLDYEKSKE
ncbi:MAG: elongation factor G [Nitrospinaceae bacterium]|nr:MAG: elongation factor G [Nitrospinaceae bacterium]